jgi:hypothetical protein
VRHRFVALVVGLVVALAACSSGGDDDSSSRGSRAPTTTTVPAPPVAPLTGLPDPNRESGTRPVLWVKIDNLDGNGVRPQTGLDLADVVYEEVVEGGITRFVAGFNSAVPDVVGPIRSVRLADPDIVWPLGGIFVYSGGGAPAVEAIDAAPVNAIDPNAAGDAMFRDNSKRAPHNLFGRGPDLFAKGGQPVPPPALFQYRAAGAPEAGEPIASFTPRFNPGYAPTYTWDPAANAWSRSIDGVPFTVASGATIVPANVVVQFTDYVGGVGLEGSQGVTVGEGEAWVFTGGQLVRGRWVRPAREQPAQYVDAAGAPIELAPGRTWVELLPIGAPVDLVPAAPAPVAPPPT